MLRYLLICLLPQLCWAQLPDLNSCEIGNSGFGYFDLTVHDPLLIGVYGSNSQITYHLSLADAGFPSTAIAGSQNFYGQDAQIIYARTQNTVTNEVFVDPFSLHADAPQPSLPSNAVVCMNIFGATINPVLLQSGLGSGYSFTWTYNGEPIVNEYNNDYLAWLPGNYSVTATTEGCSNTAFADVIAATAPYSASASQNGTTVTITATPAGQYQYALDDNSTFFDSPVFENVLPGPHIGFVRDWYGCSELAFFFDSTLNVTTNEAGIFSFGPNPVQNELLISNSTPIEGILLFDSVGRKVKELAAGTEEVRIDCSNLGPGIYFLKASADQKWQTFRFLKQ